MPITLYQDHEVEVYTRMLARAYEMIRDEPASELARDYILKEIEKVLGWKGPPPAKARPDEPGNRDKNGDDHWSDCAVNNGPALPVGECDCGGRQKTEMNMSAGQKIIEGIQQAIAGDFAHVTVAGHTWVRLDAVDTIEKCVREVVRDELRRAGLINDDSHDSQ